MQKIDDFYLFYHPELDYSSAKKDNLEIHLLGELYDWEFPEHSNSDILNDILSSIDKDSYFNILEKYFGQYILLIKTPAELILINDPCAQSEVYYDTRFIHFGSQPKLLLKVLHPEEHSDPVAKRFFKSESFLKKKLYVGGSTQYANVRHLMPNHYIDLNKKKIKRYFPVSPLIQTPTEEVAREASLILKGIIEAISKRHKTAMAVTGGYDSRVLFLASLGVECRYFVHKHKFMGEDHYDIKIPRKLTGLFKKDFEVIEDIPEERMTINEDFEKSVDFPRYYNNASEYFKDHVYLNGNIAEVARNYFGYHKQLSASDLAFINGYPGEEFVIREYQKWLDDNLDLFERMDYHYLDMFYWEEKMGNWAAKAKTEAAAVGIDVYSPFNSRGLLSILLSTKRSDRDSHINHLFDQIISILSPKVSGIPVNPDKKQNMIRLMKKLRIYNLYRNLGVKYRFLK